MPQHRKGGRLIGCVRLMPGEPVQGERHTLDVIPDGRQRLQVPQPDPAADDRDRVELAIKVDELDQRGTVQRG